jgi:hypothetical protein
MPDIASLDNQNTDLQDLAGHDEIPGHPLGVKPSGNALLAKKNLRVAIGTFNLLPDELILILLESLDGESLLRIGQTCKAFYAFTRAEDFWKSLYIG